MRLLSSMLLLTFLAAGANAQVIGGNKKPDGSDTYTMSTTVRMVVEDVTVKDKKGNPIKGLSASDFTVTEDGAPQKITFFQPQELPENAAPLVTPPGSENIQIYNRLSRTQIAPETSGTLHYKDHRLMAMYFDMSAMPPGDQVRAIAAAEKFIRTHMTAADLVAIMRYSEGSVDVLQDF